MRLSKLQAYFIGVILFILPFLIYNIIWLIGTKKVDAVVVSINKTGGIHSRNSFSATYPVYEYIVGGYTYHSAGNYNMPFKAGDTVSLRYKTGDPSKIRLNTFLGLWLQVIIWSGILVFLWTLVFLHRKIIPRGSIIHISSKGIKLLPMPGLLE